MRSLQRETMNSPPLPSYREKGKLLEGACRVGALARHLFVEAMANSGRLNPRFGDAGRSMAQQLHAGRNSRVARAGAPDNANPVGGWRELLEVARDLICIV